MKKIILYMVLGSMFTVSLSACGNSQSSAVQSKMESSIEESVDSEMIEAAGVGSDSENISSAASKSVDAESTDAEESNEFIGIWYGLDMEGAVATMDIRNDGTWHFNSEYLGSGDGEWSLTENGTIILSNSSSDMLYRMEDAASGEHMLVCIEGGITFYPSEDILNAELKAEAEYSAVEDSASTDSSGIAGIWYGVDDDNTFSSMEFNRDGTFLYIDDENSVNNICGNWSITDSGRIVISVGMFAYTGMLEGTGDSRKIVFEEEMFYPSEDARNAAVQ